MHETTRERPVDRFQRERSLLRRCRRSLSTPTSSCWPLSVPMRIEFDGNRYSTPPGLARRPVTIRAGRASSACCTKAKWWPSMSVATNAGS